MRRGGTKRRRYQPKPKRRQATRYQQKMARHSSRSVQPALATTGRSLEEQRIRIGGALRLTDNAPETFAQLRQLDDAQRKTKAYVRLFVDLSRVTDIDGAAIVYLASRLTRLKKSFVEISGNWPRSPLAVDKFRAAGLKSWLGRERPPGAGTLAADNVKLTVGRGRRRRMRPQLAARISAFLGERVTLGTEEQDALALAVNEAFENIVYHAYAPAEQTAPWFVVGVFEEQERRATVCIADYGVGIPSTLQKRFADNLRRTASDFVKLACSGVRTASGEGKRGKGLRTLREFVENGVRRRLSVISSGAMVQWVANQRPHASQLGGSVGGTIVCLEVWEPEDGHD